MSGGMGKGFCSTVCLIKKDILKMIHFALSYEELLNDKMQIVAAGTQAGRIKHRSMLKLFFGLLVSHVHSSASINETVIKM